MPLFNFLKSKKNEADVSKSATTSVNLEKKISLRKEIVADSVKNQGISVQTARVVFVLDHSGSMCRIYSDGTVQDVLERIFPIAMHFDDNAEMEFYWFDDSFKELKPVNRKTIDRYVKREILSKRESFGGTYYAPVMNAISTRYAMKEKSNIPTFVIFITDGNNSDGDATEKILKEASKYNIFWKFVGIGYENFKFLERLDDLKGRFIDNANFIKIDNISAIDDKTLYEKLLREYGDWLELCKRNGIKVE